MRPKQLLASILRRYLPVDEPVPFEHGEIVAAVFLDCLSSTQWLNRDESLACEHGLMDVIEVAVASNTDGSWSLEVHITDSNKSLPVIPMSLSDLLIDFEPTQSLTFQLLN